MFSTKGDGLSTGEIGPISKVVCVSSTRSVRGTSSLTLGLVCPHSTTLSWF